MNYSQVGAVDGADVRQRITSDASSGYNNLEDDDYIPDPELDTTKPVKKEE
jgi:hypothetical protein